MESLDMHPPTIYLLVNKYLNVENKPTLNNSIIQSSLEEQRERDK